MNKSKTQYEYYGWKMRKSNALVFKLAFVRRVFVKHNGEC